MTKYDQKAVIEGESFAKMRADTNRVLQKLLTNMVEKKTNEGTLTIKVDVSFAQEFMPIPPEEQNEKSGATRLVLKPKFKHKIGSAMQIKNEANGEYVSDMMELVYDKDTEQYILTPVRDGQQMNIFDFMGANEDDDEDDDQEEQDLEDEEEEDDDDSPRSSRLLGGGNVGLLPDNSPEDAMNAPESDDEEVIIDADYIETPPDDDSDDTEISDEEMSEFVDEHADEFIGSNESDLYDQDMPDYEYQEPFSDDDEMESSDEGEEKWD